MSTGRLILEAVRWTIGWLLLWRVATPGPAAADDGGPVAVIIPARDEAANLALLLPSLSTARATVFVVDDNSVDATAIVAADLGATVVVPGEPPEGWSGKPWACHHGVGAAEAAGFERFVFLDADVTMAAGGLDRLLAAHDPVRDGMLSVQPYHRPERPYEQLSLLFNLIGPMGVDAFTPLGDRIRPTGAFGPCLVMTAAVYDAVGGHAHPAVRSTVLEDIALADRMREQDRPVRIRAGRGTIDFRMYPEGLAQLTEGWTKGFAFGAAGTRPVTLLLVLAWVSGLLMSALALLPGDLRLGPALVVYAAFAVQLLVLARRVGRFHPLASLAFPVPLAYFFFVFGRSLVLTFGRRQVRWRGRDLSTRRAGS